MTSTFSAIYDDILTDFKKFIFLETYNHNEDIYRGLKHCDQTNIG